MASSPPSQKRSDEVSLDELIFSCSICQAITSEVYASPESNKDFGSVSGEEQEDAIVTKMWIAECSHITCSKHLEGGAAPFHAQKSEPRAACPRCKQDSGDDSAKALYAIRGLGEGECDEVIPREWRTCPPVNLDRSSPGMEAVRFQYMALAHYAKRIRIQAHDAIVKQQALEVSWTRERKQRRQLQREALDLQKRLEHLQETESKLEMWETRKPKICHYLGVFGEMMSEIHSHRALLSELGYQVTSKGYAFPGDAVDQAEQAHEQRRSTDGAQNGISSATTAVAHDAKHTSAAKRRSDRPTAQEYGSHPGNAKGSSRDMMPPPLPRLKRRKLSHSPHQPAPASASIVRHPDQRRREQLPFRPPLRQEQMPRTTPYSSFRRQSEESSVYEPHSPPATEAYENSQLLEPFHSSKQQALMRDPRPASPLEAQVNHFQHKGDHPWIASYHEACGPLGAQQHLQNRVRLTVDGHNANQLGGGLSIDGYGSSQSVQPCVKSTVARSPLFGKPAYIESQASQYAVRESGSRSRGASLQQALFRYEPGKPANSSLAARLRGAKETKPAYRPVHTDEHEGRREAYGPPQPPRSTQGFLQRPDEPPLRMAYASTAGPGKTQRARILLPPTNCPVGKSSCDDQDGLISRIQGVRGLASRQSQASGPLPSQAFGAPRQLFSAAGSRRSVRR